MKNMVQTWANYYAHIVNNLTEEEIHETLAKEREIHLKTIERAKEHLEGIDLFYEQSPYKPSSVDI